MFCSSHFRQTWFTLELPHQTTQRVRHCQSEIPSGPSPWLARVLLTLILPGFSASNSHLVLFLDPAFHLPGNLVLNLCYKRTATIGVLNWCVYTSRNTKELSKGWVDKGGYKNQFLHPQLFYVRFPKTNSSQEKLIEKEQAFVSHFLLHFSLLARKVCFSLFQAYPRYLTQGHKEPKRAKQRDTWKISVLVTLSCSLLSTTLKEALMESSANESLKILFDYRFGYTPEFQTIEKCSYNKTSLLPIFSFTEQVCWCFHLLKSRKKNRNQAEPCLILAMLRQPQFNSTRKLN